MIHKFNPEMSLRENWQLGAEIAFAAWAFASHEHREEFRHSGKLPHRSAALEWIRIRELKEALSLGKFVALAIEDNDKSSSVIRIPATVLDASDLKIEHENWTITALGRGFLDVRICELEVNHVAGEDQAKRPGRPDLLELLSHAWSELKLANADFLEWPKSRQNRDVREKVAELHPGQFPGKSQPGDSTLRRHRREHSDRFD